MMIYSSAVSVSGLSKMPRAPPFCQCHEEVRLGEHDRLQHFKMRPITGTKQPGLMSFFNH